MYYLKCCGVRKETQMIRKLHKFLKLETARTFFLFLQFLKRSLHKLHQMKAELKGQTYLSTCVIYVTTERISMKFGIGDSISKFVGRV